MSYTLKLNGGKYTVINHRDSMEFLRYGETWPAANNLRYDNLVHALAQRIEELEVAIKAVVDGSLLPGGDRERDGIRSYGTSGTGIPLRRWETTLRNVLEQK